MSAQRLLAELARLDVKVKANGGKLSYEAPKGTMTPELLAQLKEHKAEILERLAPRYSFDERAECEVDAWKFREHQQRAGAAQEAEELDVAIREYREALDLVSGEFLAEEPYEDWAMEAREEWHKHQLAILSGLAECLALKGRYAEAIEACEKALALDEYREELHRRLMLYRYCTGEQGLALRAYRDYAQTLKEELGTTPSPELVRLKEQIEARDVPGVDERRRYPRPRRSLRFPYSLSRTRFVGRDEEYAWLVERLREAAEGVGGAVAVEGEAEVGKTRLAQPVEKLLRTLLLTPFWAPRVPLLGVLKPVGIHGSSQRRLFQQGRGFLIHHLKT